MNFAGLFWVDLSVDVYGQSATILDADATRALAIRRF